MHVWRGDRASLLANISHKTFTQVSFSDQIVGRRRLFTIAACLLRATAAPSPARCSGALS